MNRSSFLTATAVLVLFVPAATGQFTLQTLFTGGNTNKGQMFDLTNISSGPIIITGFDQTFSGNGTANYEIFARTGGGSYVGSETNPAAWTLSGFANGIAHTGVGTAITLPIALTVSIPAGGTQGFYLTCTSGTTSNVAYTAGAPGQLGTVYVQDPRLQLKVGVGKGYAFGTTTTGTQNQGRIFNGRVRYNASGLFAQFVGTPTTGNAPMSVNFTDQSLSTSGPITSREWDFQNDGIVDSTALNPTFIYGTPGIYSVRLTVQNGIDPASTQIRTNYITVNPELLAINSTGNGDLTMSGPDDPPGATEGFLFVSTSIPPTLGSGFFFGLNFDGLVASILLTPAQPCDLLHWIPTAGCWPNINLAFGPGTVNLPPGTTLDAVMIQVVGGVLVISNADRVVF